MTDTLLSPPFTTPSREAGLSQMKRFAPLMGRDYAGQRNYDFGPGQHGNVSCLSPYLRHRLILEEEAVATALAHHSASAAEKYVQEVFWRSYFKGWLAHRPGVWIAYQAQLRDDLATLKGNAGLRKAYDEAVEGRSGIAPLDEWSRELRETGYLHNHARMWFASIWIFTLRLPWTLGADFFFRHLLDGDPASNTLSWRWVAGLHTVGKNYVARASNITKYTEGRFGAVHGLAPDPPPLDPDGPFAIEALPDLPAAPDRASLALLLTEDDLSPETFLAGPFEHVLILDQTARRSPLGTGSLPRAFAAGAIRDAASRLALRYDCPVEVVTRVDEAETYARDHGITQFASPLSPQGPGADALTRLAERGIGITRVQRQWDRLCWPHCKKGFFGLKKKIPDILARHNSLF